MKDMDIPFGGGPEPELKGDGCTGLTEETSGGKKFDQGKVEPALLPPLALLTVSNVLTFGAKKYGADNWRYVKNGRHRYMNAALRHLLADLAGQENDEDSELPHLAHAACCLLFLIEMSARAKAGLDSFPE